MSHPKEEQALDIPIISSLLGGPLRRGKVLLFLYEPSTQWLSLILTIVSELVRRGNVVALTTVSTPPSQLRQQLAVTLPNLKEHETAKRLTMIDWYTWMTGKKSTEPRSVESLKLAEFNIQDSKFQVDDSPLYDFLAVENYSTFLKYNDERSFMQWLDKTIARMRELKGVRLYGFMKHFHSDPFYANLELMTDGVIELDMQEGAKGLENRIRAKSMRSIEHSTEWRTLKLTRSGLLTLTHKRR